MKAKIFLLPPGVVFEVMGNKSLEMQSHLLSWDLPPDVEFSSCQFDPYKRAFAVTVKHDSFEDVLFGEELPVVNPVIRSKLVDNPHYRYKDLFGKIVIEKSLQNDLTQPIKYIIGMVDDDTAMVATDDFPGCKIPIDNLIIGDVTDHAYAMELRGRYESQFPGTIS